MLFVLKVKGKAKIPDYIQLRDESHSLLGYFRADRPIKDLSKYGLEGKEQQFQKLINELEFGKMVSIDF